MKINLSQSVTGPDGNPVRVQRGVDPQSGNEITSGATFAGIAVAFISQHRTRTDEEAVKYFALAEKIVSAEAEVDLDESELEIVDKAFFGQPVALKGAYLKLKK